MLVLGVTGYIVVVNRGGPPDDPTPRDTAAEEMAQLQEQFKRYMENRLDFTDLLPDARAYTKRHPDDPAGYILLAQVLMKMERYGEAYPALAEALRDNPDHFELQKLTGTCAAKLGLWEDAERHLLAAHDLKEDETVILQLGNVFYETDRLDEAEEMYVAAKALSGMTPPHKANAGLAEVYAARGDLDRALQFISLAIRWADGDSEAEVWVYQLNKVRLLFDAGQWAAGEQLLRQTRAEYPEAVYLLAGARLRARLYAQQGDLPSAARELENLVYAPAGQTDPERADILAELAHWQLEAGNTARAGEAVAALRALVPEHPRLAELEARLAAE